MTFRLPAWRYLFALLVAFYVVGTAGRIYSPDGVIMGRVTESLVERGELAIDGSGYPPGFLATGREGRQYGKYGLGQSLVAVPFYLVGRGFEVVSASSADPLFRGPRFLWYRPAEGWRFFGLGLTNAVLVALACALLFPIALEAGLSRRGAVAGVAIAAVASPLWVYSKTFFSEPLAAAGMTLFAWGLVGHRRDGRRVSGVIAGGGLGLAILAKIAHLVLLPVAAVAVAMVVLRREVGWQRRFGSASSFGLGALVALALVGGLNVVRFGDPLATGYGAEGARFTTPLGEGLAGLLVSPGRGLVLYFPAVLLGAALVGFWWRRDPALTILTWGSLATLLALYGRWHGWDGGWCWGPRFLVPVLPLLALQCAPLFDTPAALPALIRWGGRLLVALSALMAVVGVLVPFTEYHALLREVFGPQQYLLVARWSWAAFPLLGYWRLPWTFFIAPQVFHLPQLWWLAGSFGVLAGALVPLAEASRALVSTPDEVQSSWRRGGLGWAVLPIAGGVFGALWALL